MLLGGAALRRRGRGDDARRGTGRLVAGRCSRSPPCARCRRRSRRWWSVSLATRPTGCRRTWAATMVRLHAPEALELDRGSYRAEGRPGLTTHRSSQRIDRSSRCDGAHSAPFGPLAATATVTPVTALSQVPSLGPATDPRSPDVHDCTTPRPPCPHSTLPGAHIADPAPLGLAAFALTTFILSFVNTDLVQGRAGRVRAGSRLRRSRPAAGRHVGVRQGQHLRRHRVLVVRRVLALVLVPHRAHRPERRLRRRRLQHDRPLPAGLGHLHRLHDHRRHPGQRRRAGGVRAADAHLPGARLGRVRHVRAASTRPAAGSASPPPSPPGTPRSPGSRPSPSSSPLVPTRSTGDGGRVWPLSHRPSLHPEPTSATRGERGRSEQRDPVEPVARGAPLRSAGPSSRRART